MDEEDTSEMEEEKTRGRKKNKPRDGERTNCFPLLSRVPLLSLSLPFAHFYHESTSFLALKHGQCGNCAKKIKIQKTVP